MLLNLLLCGRVVRLHWHRLHSRLLLLVVLLLLPLPHVPERRLAPRMPLRFGIRRGFGGGGLGGSLPSCRGSAVPLPIFVLAAFTFSLRAVVRPTPAVDAISFDELLGHVHGFFQLCRRPCHREGALVPLLSVPHAGAAPGLLVDLDAVRRREGSCPA